MSAEASFPTAPPAVCAECGLLSHAGVIDHQAVADASALLEALGDPVRLGIVELLSRHERLCVCEIATAFDVAQPTVSHHLRVLREAGLVDVVRRGHWAYYGLRRETIKRVVLDLVRYL
ncbi:MAG: metalloregulator ArsR/SmtB family transcription factor [Armatimonadota bacterium]|nr:metalloregulator ArsR/SmtB family transcription factor [Armatimonadota bacterium]